MAVPLEVTTLNLTGTYVMNKSLSDDMDEILRLQGMGWLVRKMISSATVTMCIKHYKDADGVEHIDIDQVATGGKSNKEQRVLNWTDAEVEAEEHHGDARRLRRTRRIPIDQVENEWQKQGWLADTFEHGAIQALATCNMKNGDSWVMDVIWGFAEVDGLRKYTRKVHFTGPKGEDIKARLVYDYKGPSTRE